MQEENRALELVRRVAEDGGVAVWVEAAGDGGTWREIDAEALRAAGDATIGADLGLGAHAPDIGPPRAARGGTEGTAVFAVCEIPGGLRSGADLAVPFLGVVMAAELVEQRVGLGQRGDMLCGEESREALLPEIMGAFDFPLGLRGGRVAQGDFVEAQGRAELGQGIGDGGEVKGVIVHVESEREADFEEDRGQQIEMGEEPLVVVDAGAGQDAAVVVDEFEQRVLAWRAGEPAVRGGVVLPESSGAR